MGAVTIKKHVNGLQYLDVNTLHCTARIFLQGAHIDAFQPKGEKPLLWTSAANDYQAGCGIRGGVPICWPWFGAHATAGFPQHGFARTSLWDLDSVNEYDDALEITLSLSISDDNKPYWPHHTGVAVCFRLSDTLSISLININHGDSDVSLTQALHSYFPIGDIHQLQASGFKGAKYVEFAQGPYPQSQDHVLFNAETDRVYTDLGSVQQLHTTDGVIEICRENSASAVLWNPWIDKSQRLSRFNDHDYLSMVCLEAANVAEDKITLAPNTRHTLTTHIRWL